MEGSHLGSVRRKMTPLDGIVVIDLTRALAGPYGTMILGDLGADVIKVEAPGAGDEARGWGPPFLGGESYYFMSLNRNKKSIVVDLKRDQGVEVVHRLAKRADIFVENFRPGTARRLGVDYETLSELNPRLIYCSISGFGQTGPYRERPGYDIVAYAMSGIMDMTGEEGRPPVKVGVPVSDLAAGMFAVQGILAALLVRERTGRGQLVDVSLLDGQISWLTFQAGLFFGTGENPSRMGSAHPLIVPYQAFRASDRHFILAVGNDGHWRDICAALELKDLAGDPRYRTNAQRVRNRHELVKVLGELFATKDARHWLGKLEKAGVPCGPINTIGEALSDPHVRARGMIVEIAHPTAGTIKVLNTPFKLSDTPGGVRAPSPTLGRDTETILFSLGYSKAEIDALRSGGAVG